MPFKKDLSILKILLFMLIIYSFIIQQPVFDSNTHQNTEQRRPGMVQEQLVCYHTFPLVFCLCCVTLYYWNTWAISDNSSYLRYSQDE